MGDIVDSEQTAPPPASRALSALEHLADEHTLPILRCTRGGPRLQRELEAELPHVAHATLHGRLLRLEDAGAVARERVGRSYACSLTPAGEGLVAIGDVLARWTASARTGDPLPGWLMVRALHEGWASGIVPALAAAPLPRAALDARIALTHHQLQGRLDRLHRAGIVERSSASRAPTHAISTLGRRGTGLVVHAVAWQREFERQDRWATGPGNLRDAMQVGLPLLHMGNLLSGLLTLAFIEPDADARSAGMTATIQRGRAIALLPTQDTQPTAVVHGTVASWCAAIAGDLPGRLRTEGNRAFHGPLVHELHGRLVL